MKTIETTTRKRFSNASLEALLNTAFENLIAHIKLKGQQLGKNNLPRLIGDSMKSYFEKFLHEYQTLLDIINTELQCQVTCFEVMENDQLSDTAIRDLELKLSDAEHQVISVNTELKNTPIPANRFSKAKAWICIGIVASFDSLLNIKYFELMGNSYLEAIGIGITFAGVVMIFTHFVPRIIRMGKTALQQRLIAFTIFIFMTIVFSYLARLRSDYLNANGISGVHYSPWFFVILSLFLFATAVFVYMFRMPTKADIDAIQRYNTLLSREQAIKDAISNLTAQIATARTDKSTFRIDNSSIVVYGNGLEKQVISQAKVGYATLKDEMLAYRSDHGKPDCFDADYSFNFNRNFDQID